MVLFNYSTRELTAKIVYYGPGLCGKTTNLQFIHENLPGEVRGKMLSLATKTDRTLFFDFLPIDLGEIRGMKTRVQLYTVPGQVFYNETRKLVLKGADGIVFVADSQETMIGANVESFKNLEENLKAHGMKLGEMPHVIQFNKRDLPKLTGIEDLNAALNKYNAPFYESVATTGIGVQDTLKAIVKLVLLQLTRKYDPKSLPASADLPQQASRAGASAPAPVVPPSPAAPAPAARAARSAAPPTPPPLQREASSASVPLSAMDAPPKAAPARPAASPASSKRAPAPAETMPPFAEAEIDDLVGEVGDLEATPSAPEPVPAPVAVPLAAEAPAAADDGIWLGAPEGDESQFSDSGSAYGSTVPLEDLLANEGMPPKVEARSRSIAPAPEDTSFGSAFEVDRGFDPEWPSGADAAPRAASPSKPAPARSTPPAPAKPAASAKPAPSADDVPIAPFPIPVEGRDDGDDDVLLTEVASGDDLFNDPTLEIAQLGDGTAREIVVPVMLGEGATARRYKLSIRLRLDPAD